jgi:peptide chain release factor subunit 3
MGKLESGHIKKGASILVMPTKKTCEVVGIFEDENELQIAHNGDNVRLRLKGISEEDLQPGYVLCGLKNPVHAVTSFEAQLQIVEYPSIMCAGYGSIMHAHTTREEVTIAVIYVLRQEILHKIDKKTKRKSKHAPPFMRQGDVCIVRIEGTRNICLESYEDYPQLGRFTLRDENRTVAVGKILKLIE